MPRLAERLLFRADLWLRARLLPFRVGRRPFQEVLALAPPHAALRYPGLSADYIAKAVHRAVRHPVMMRDRRCLREGLLGFALMREAGLEPELHFGIDPRSTTADKLSAHCWVCLDGAPVLSDRLPGMVTIYVHPAPIHPAPNAHPVPA